MTYTEKNVDILVTILGVLYNYLNNPTKSFLNLYLVKYR